MRINLYTHCGIVYASRIDVKIHAAGFIFIYSLVHVALPNTQRVAILKYLWHMQKHVLSNAGDRHAVGPEYADMGELA